MATLITNDGIRRVDDNYLMHWAKGSEAKNHKWIKRVMGKNGKWQYFYNDDKYNAASKKAKHDNHIADNSEKAAKANYISEGRLHKAYEDGFTIKRNDGKLQYDPNLNKIPDSAKRAKLNQMHKDTNKEWEHFTTGYTKDAEDAKRQANSALAAAQREKSKKLSNRGKKVINKIKKIPVHTLDVTFDDGSGYTTTEHLDGTTSTKRKRKNK